MRNPTRGVKADFGGRISRGILDSFLERKKRDFVLFWEKEKRRKIEKKFSLLSLKERKK